MQDSVYQRCTRCVMDTTDPEITFDENGFCNHCNYAFNNFNTHVLSGVAGKRRISSKVSEIKARNKRKKYDVIMGLSGGVDSSYAVSLAHSLGLRILAVHCDTGWNSEEATHNVHSLVNKLGIDLHTEVINWETMRELQAAFFKASVPNCDIPQDHAIVAVNNRIAAKYGVKDFITGGNFVGESIFPSAWGYDARDLRHLKAISKIFGNGDLKGFPTFNGFIQYFWSPFVLGIKNYRILNDADYNPILAKQELIEQYGWKDYGGKHHESVFTRFYQAYYLPEKFGFDKRKIHLSSLIVSGLVSRNEALLELEKPLYDERQLRSDKKFFLSKLGFSSSDWDLIMKQDAKKHTDFPTNLYWKQYLQRLKVFLEKNGKRVRRSW
ncbi:TPA: N-acetyl sugar amidotransferase [Vibrio mimicus]